MCTVEKLWQNTFFCCSSYVNNFCNIWSQFSKEWYLYSLSDPSANVQHRLRILIYKHNDVTLYNDTLLPAHMLIPFHVLPFHVDRINSVPKHQHQLAKIKYKKFSIQLRIFIILIQSKYTIQLIPIHPSQSKCIIQPLPHLPQPFELAQSNPPWRTHT